jgi:hypothetical protein
MDIRVNSSEFSVSVMTVNNGKVSIASADNLLDGRWWISRVNVQGVEKGKGVGSILLQRLLQEVLKLGQTKIIVSPGGYYEDKDRQFNFYKKNGFIESEESSELLIYKNNE